MAKHKKPSSLTELSKFIEEIIYPMAHDADNNIWIDNIANKSIALFQKYQQEKLEQILYDGITNKHSSKLAKQNQDANNFNLPWSQDFIYFLCRLTPQAIAHLRTIISGQNLLPLTFRI